MRTFKPDSLAIVAVAIAIFAVAHDKAAFADAHELDISITRAPIVPDGTSAGAQTDFVMTFRDRAPSVDGISLQSGGTVTVQFSDAFTPGPGGNLILLQGWPQSPPAPPPLFPWSTVINGNTVTATMTGPFDPTTTFGPGPKQVHVLLPGFRNPGPGRYPIELTIDLDGTGTDILSGVGWVQIIPKARPAVSVISIFSGPPGPPPPFFNPLYQTVLAGESSHNIGLYLWNRNSVPAEGVDISMTNRHHGRLVQGGETVGQVWIQAPPGASFYSLSTDGASVIMDAFPFTLGVQTGVLIMRLNTDPNVSGEYVIDVSMNGGNTESISVIAE